MQYDYVVFPKTKSLRGITLSLNGYLFFEDHHELHLVRDDKILNIVCDLDSFEKLKNHYWCLSMVGREGYKSPQIYCNINRIKHMLKDYLFPEYIGSTIEFINNDCLDFRRFNIRVRNGVSKKECRNTKNKHGENLPVGITCTIQKFNGETKIIGYHVRAGSPLYKYFGIKEYKTQKIALREALKYYKKVNNHI